MDNVEEFNIDRGKSTKNSNGLKIDLNVQERKKLIPLDKLLKNRITDDSEIPEEEPVVTIQNTAFAVKGDISVVSGLPKAGKTSISVPILATALMDKIPDELDTLQIRSTPSNGKPVIYIDTEQSSSSTNKLRLAINNLAGFDKSPKNLFIINLRKISKPEEKLQNVTSLFYHFKDAHIWVIDGLADLLSDPNNTIESFELISYFMSLSEKLNTSIIFYLHENPGTSKMRGNLGSEMERKCFGAITVKKDKDKKSHSIISRHLRGSADFETIYCHYDKELGRLVSMHPAEQKELRKQSDPEEIKKKLRKKLAIQCLLDGFEHISYTEFCRRIENYSEKIEGKTIKSKQTQTVRIKEMLELKIINKDDKGLYYLVQQTEDSDK